MLRVGSNLLDQLIMLPQLFEASLLSLLDDKVSSQVNAIVEISGEDDDVVVKHHRPAVFGLSLSHQCKPYFVRGSTHSPPPMSGKRWKVSTPREA